MKRLFDLAVRISFVALALSLPRESAWAAEWTLEGHVVGVSDGQTITVLDDAKTQHEIHLLGIDAPETEQAFGEQSRKNLSALVLQKRVEARCHKRDRHGQQACAVFVGLHDVGFAQIRAGMAWWDRAYAREQRAHERQLYRDAELAAKVLRAGLWREAMPVPPWEWRKGDRDKR